MFENRFGLSLIELMVVLAVVGIVSVGMADYISHISDEQRIMMQNTEALSIDNNLTTLMTPDMPHCTGNIYAANITFTGAPPATANLACPGSSCAQNALYYYTPSGTKLAKDIVTGTDLDSTGLEVSSVELINISGTGPYTANVVINFSSPIPPDPPSFELPAPIMINASTSSGGTKLQSCVQQTMTSGLTPELPPGHVGPGNCLGPPSIPAGWFPLKKLGPQKNCFAYVVANGAGNSFSSEGCYYNSIDGWIYGCDNNSAIFCGWTCFQ